MIQIVQVKSCVVACRIAVYEDIWEIPVGTTRYNWDYHKPISCNLGRLTISQILF